MKAEALMVSVLTPDPVLTLRASPVVAAAALAAEARVMLLAPFVKSTFSTLVTLAKSLSTTVAALSKAILS